MKVVSCTSDKGFVRMSYKKTLLLGTRSSEQLPPSPGGVSSPRGRNPCYHEQAHEATAHRREVWRQESKYIIYLELTNLRLTFYVNVN